MTSEVSECNAGTSTSRQCQKDDEKAELDAVTGTIPSDVIEVELIPRDDVQLSDGNCASDVENGDNNNDSVDDDINSIIPCANCLKNCDIRTEKCFECDDCDHLLCLKCRFVQNDGCKMCRVKSKVNSTVSASANLNLSADHTQKQEDFCSNCNNKSDIESAKKYNKISTGIRKYILPDYIDVLPRNQTNETGYRCSICKKVFFYKLQAKYHEACFTGQRPLKCDMCDKTFITKSHLKYHLQSHTGIKPYKCNICNKGFIQRAKLTRHMSIHSGAKKPFTCEICSRSFTAKQTYDTHLRTHSGERPFNCKMCRRRFISKTGLKNHELRHAGVKDFVCERCGKRFVLKAQLFSHQKWHLNIRPHSCTKCGVAFVERNDLVRHMQIHTDTERDYECSICITAFRRKDNLERHMKNTHPETITKYGRAQHIVSVVKVDNNVCLNFVNNKSAAVKTNTSNHVAAIVKTSSNEDPKELANQTDENIQSDAKVVEETPKNSEDELDLNKTKDCGNSNSLGSDINNDKVVLDERIENSSEVIKNISTTKSGIVNFTSTSENPKEVPKSNQVSVINSTKSYKSNISKVPKNINNDKKTETLSPYRLITPPVKPLDTNGNNCVPTITKVTHIVHTSNTGVSNVKTLITTRNMSEKSAKKMKKDKRLSTEQQPLENKNENKTINKQRGGVIKYVSRNNNKNTSETKHKYYRILKLSNNQCITTMSSICNSDSINDTLTSQPLDVTDNSVFSEPAASVKSVVYKNADYSNNFQPDPNVLDRPSNENSGIVMVNNSCNINAVNNTMYNNDIENTFPIQSDSIYGINKIYDTTENANKNLPPYCNVSESCLLADNVLDDSITASLYMDDDSNSRINESYEPAPHDAFGNRDILDPVCTLNYPIGVLNGLYDQNKKQLLQNISEMGNQIDYDCVDRVETVNDTNGSEPYNEIHLLEQSSDYSFENGANMNDCNVQELPTDAVDFDDSSSIHLQDLIKVSGSNSSSKQKTCTSNDLVTLANMACARANLNHPT